MWSDFSSLPIEISVLLGLCVFEGSLLLVVRHPYVRAKIRGWIMITSFFACFFLPRPIPELAALAAAGLAVREFWRLLAEDGWRIRIAFGIPFLLLLAGYCAEALLYPREMLALFVAVSVSDVIAYLVGKGLPWRKGFTSLSPNKTLSGTLAQGIFLFAAVGFFVVPDAFPPLVSIPLALAIAFFGPAGDLLESFFKRRAGVKDTADYIPGHGGVLDRIDSSLIGANILLLATFFT